MKTRTLASVLVLIAAFLLPATGQTVADAQNQAVTKYPDLAREGSALHTKFLELYRNAQQSDPTLLANPNWPLILADKASAVLATTSTPASPSTPPPPEPPPNAEPPSAPGQATITGAFGRKLGDIFDPTTAIGTGALTDGTPMYQFQPDKPFRSFTSYFLLITPATHKVYAIWGIGPCANTESGKKEQALLMELLKQKYGPQDADGLMDGFYDSEHISKGSRYVMTKVTGITDITVEVRYQDQDLEKIAEQERLKLEGKKVDPSGL